MKNFITCIFLGITLVACKTGAASPVLQQSTPQQKSFQVIDTPTKTDSSITSEKILITNQRNYYIANPDGSERALLYSGEQSPLEMASLSSDAAKFAYFMNNFVYVKDVATDNTTVLNKEVIGSMGGQIRWSPDGAELAMTCSKEQQPSLAICLIDTQNGQIEILINQNNTDEFCSSNYIELQDWSKDGSTMIYTCFTIPEKGKKQEFSVYLYDLASKTSKKILDEITQDTIWRIISASISPDKNYLLLTGAHQDYIEQVFLFDLTNSNLKQLTSETDYNSSALAWRNDGKSFYLHKTLAQIPYNESNFVMNINGTILFSLKIDGTIIK